MLKMEIINSQLIQIFGLLLDGFGVLLITIGFWKQKPIDVAKSYKHFNGETQTFSQIKGRNEAVFGGVLLLSGFVLQLFSVIFIVDIKDVIGIFAFALVIFGIIYFLLTERNKKTIEDVKNFFNED